MLTFIIRWWKRFNCKHEWQFAGVSVDEDRSWYWHRERCDDCGEEQEIINNYLWDDCGHCTNGQ